MTREEFHAESRRKAEREGLATEAFDAIFRTYPCWCGAALCPGWQTLTDREADIIIASQPNLGHSPGFLEAFHPLSQEDPER